MIPAIYGHPTSGEWEGREDTFSYAEGKMIPWKDCVRAIACILTYGGCWNRVSMMAGTNLYN
jgi:hypothetical protein